MTTEQASKTKLVWIPQPKQEIFQTNLAYECLFGGAKGPGKSDALLVESTRQVQHPRYKALITRRTYPKLEELINRSHHLFHDKAKWSGKTYCWNWPSGAIIRFVHCQDEEDKYNIQGHEYQFMGFDQLEEYTFTIYDFMKLQCRSSSPGLRCYIRATANPCGVGHQWVKNRFIDCCPPDGSLRYFKKIFDPVSAQEIEVEAEPNDPKALSRSFIFATVDDNPALLKADPTYIIKLESISDPNLRRALRHGDWEAFQGQYFTEWRREHHIISQDYFKALIQVMPCSRFMAMDYGYRKPSSVGWYANFPDGQIIRYRELYKEGFTYEQIAREILKLTPDYEKIDYLVGDPAMQGDRAHHNNDKDGEASGKSGADLMREILGERIPFLLGDNRRVVGWGRVRDYLKLYSDQHGATTALLRVTDNCRNLIRTLPSMIYDQSKAEDLDTKGEDHAVDELRYALMSRQHTPAAKPQPITITSEFWDRVKADIKKSSDSDDGNIEEDGEYISD